MKKRRALLIGVPEYESDAIDDLPIVRTDIETLHASLEKSGFSVRSLGVDGTSQTGRSKILQSLRRECKEAQGVETLLLYFSGHGMHYRGKDYLIPSDAVLDDADFVEEYLVPTDLGEIIDQSGAETVIFCVDACREGVKLDFKASYLAGWSRGERRQALRRSLVLVFACGPGQVSQYLGGEEGFSLFSKALAEVLDPQHSACTLREVLDETQVRLNALVAEHGKQPQKIYCAYESAVENDTSLRVICEGVAAIADRGRVSDPWSEAALQSSLWQAEGDDEDCPVVQLKQQVAKVLAACWQQWQAAVRTFPQDPWRDEELPIRVLESLGLLVFRSDPPVELTVAETALIVTVPFVREAVLASGVVQAAQANPLSLEEINPKIGFRSVLDKVHQAQPRFVRKAQRLKEQGRIADKDAVMAWLMHQCLLQSLEVWQPESAGGCLSSNFIRALDDVSCCRSRLVKETLARKRLLELTRCMYADFERIDRDDHPDALQFRVTVGRYWEEQEIREKMLAYLLKLAGLLAIDGRTLSDVLVDHIGLADPLTPEDVRNTVTQAYWNPSGRGRTLRVTCNHPSIDLALREHIEQASAVLTHIFRQVGEKRQGMEVLAGLPTHLMPDGITAEKQDGVPVYQTPHLNFELAHDEVRELLMGEQLYGDPMLAIRELYQNALDACRYREARLKYLKHTGQYQGAEEEWEGKIIFRQRTDENGRAYIECEDNGIGMGMLHLCQCFARAGRRFADLPEFIEEQAEWVKCDPSFRLYPNSQFGVGVLSYFMLADEIEVETCRLDRKGRPGVQLRVRIPGSSGLFRVRKLGIGNNAGTRVRLYLNRTHHRGQIISCIETLRRLLWVAEFRTEVQQFGRQEIWEPGQLRHPDYPQSYCLNIEGTDVWWVPESDYWFIKKGCILSDGLWTGESQPGLVVNLRREHLPRLTVDRKNIVEWDKEWVRRTLIEYSEPLLNWCHLDFKLLWKLAQEHPQIAVHIVERLSTERANIQVGRWSSSNLEVPIAEISCFESDTWLEYFKYGFSAQSLRFYIPWWILPYRVILWGCYGLFKISEPFLASLPKLIQPEHCPKPQPGDGIALQEDLPPEGYAFFPLEDYVPPAHIIHTAAKLNEPLALTVRRFHRFASLGLEIPELSVNLIARIQIEEEDIIALSRRIDEVYPLNRRTQQWKKIWVEKRISAAQIILTSTRLSASVADTIRRFRRFTPIGLEIVEIDPEAVGKINITPEDIIALSQQLNGEEALPRDSISPAHIAFAAKRLNEPVSVTLKRFQKFLPIGLELPNIALELLNNFVVTQEDLIALSEEPERGMDREVALSEDRITVAQLVRASHLLNQSVVDTFKQLERFAPLGLKLPKIALDSLDNFTVTREDVIAFSESDTSRYSRYSIGKSTWLEDRLTPAHLVIATIRLNESVTDSLKRFQKFTSLGLEVPQMSLKCLEALIGTEENLIALSKTLKEKPMNPKDILQGKIHPTRIILAALALKEPVDVTLERFRRFAPVLGLILPEGEPESWRWCTGESDESAKKL